MSKPEKMSYDPNLPEWQLFQNMKSNKLLVGTYIKDAERYTQMSEAARKKYELYLDALLKLDSDFNEDNYE